MIFIKYSGSDISCELHDDKLNKVFRNGNKVDANSIIYSFEEESRKDCWLDFDHFAFVALDNFKKSWSEIKNLSVDEMESIADENDDVYNLLSSLNLTDDDLLAHFREKRLEFLEETASA